jgi:hypothetical protein
VSQLDHVDLVARNDLHRRRSARLFDHATTPGLRATIVETVNVLLKGGEVSRVMITGEISLSHRAETTDGEGVRIRIAHFEQSEKAAPNSAYLSPIVGSPLFRLVSRSPLFSLLSSPTIFSLSSARRPDSHQIMDPASSLRYVRFMPKAVQLQLGARPEGTRRAWTGRSGG